jgi:hypothetical protein
MEKKSFGIESAFIDFTPRLYLHNRPFRDTLDNTYFYADSVRKRWYFWLRNPLCPYS